MTSDDQEKHNPRIHSFFIPADLTDAERATRAKIASERAEQRRIDQEELESDPFYQYAMNEANEQNARLVEAGRIEAARQLEIEQKLVEAEAKQIALETDKANIKAELDAQLSAKVRRAAGPVVYRKFEALMREKIVEAICELGEDYVGWPTNWQVKHPAETSGKLARKIAARYSEKWEVEADRIASLPDNTEKRNAAFKAEWEDARSQKKRAIKSIAARIKKLAKLTYN